MVRMADRLASAAVLAAAFFSASASCAPTCSFTRSKMLNSVMVSAPFACLRYPGAPIRPGPGHHQGSGRFAPANRPGEPGILPECPEVAGGALWALWEP